MLLINYPLPVHFFYRFFLKDLTMNFISRVKRAYSQHIKSAQTPRSIIIQMGYHKLHIKRLNSLILTRTLGFKSGAFFFNYKHRNFVEKLLLRLDIPATQIKLAQDVIIEHYESQSGELSIWGTIKRNDVYCHAGNGLTARLYFTPKGKLIEPRLSA